LPVLYETLKPIDGAGRQNLPVFRQRAVTIEWVGLGKPVEMKSVAGQEPLGLVPFWFVERLLHSAATVIDLDVKQ